MKALVRSIVMVAILVPFTVNAAPAKKPGKKGGPNSVEMESEKKQKQGKQGKQGKSYNGKKKGKKATAVFVVQKGHRESVNEARRERARRQAVANERRRVAALMAGHHVVYTHNWVVTPRVASDRAMRGIVLDLELARGPMTKLDILRHASAQRYFTVRQARVLLREFGSQQVRLEALKVLRTKIVDRRNFHKLLRVFNGHNAKESAAMMLAQL